jgi:hypothetical protein
MLAFLGFGGSDGSSISVAVNSILSQVGSFEGFVEHAAEFSANRLDGRTLGIDALGAISVFTFLRRRWPAWPL